MPLEKEERDTLLRNIDTAAGKVVGKMIFGMRDAMGREAFLESVESMEQIYDEK